MRARLSIPCNWRHNNVHEDALIELVLENGLFLKA